MPSPRGGNESHHGIMSAWMKKVFGDAYNPDLAPAILMPTTDHNTTRGLYNGWRTQIIRDQGSFSWGNVSEQEIRRLANQMFDAGNIPQSVRQEYWKQFNKLIQELRRP